MAILATVDGWPRAEVAGKVKGSPLEGVAKSRQLECKLIEFY